MAAEEVGELSDALRAMLEEADNMFELRELDLGDAGAVFLAEKLRGNTLVEELWLEKCGIGVVGARALAESLSGHTDSLKMMFLFGNEGIGDDGAQALAQMLKRNTTLECLNLSGCGVRNRGARALSEALKENFTLEFLNLSRNSINDDGAEALAEGLRWNESLEFLGLGGAELTEAGALSLLAALRESNSTLTELDLDYQPALNDSIKRHDEIEDSKNDLLVENMEVKPASAERRARCLLFCCLKLAPNAHESVVPSIGAVPVPVMQYAVEHAGKLHVAKRFEYSTVVAGQFSSVREIRGLQLAQLQQQNAQLQQQNRQLQQENTQLRQQITQPISRITDLNAAAGASLASHPSTLSGDEGDGEPANKRAKTA